MITIELETKSPYHFTITHSNGFRLCTVEEVPEELKSPDDGSVVEYSLRFKIECAHLTKDEAGTTIAEIRQMLDLFHPRIRECLARNELFEVIFEHLND